MRKPVKILAWLLGLVLVLVVAVTVAVKVFITKEMVLSWVEPPLEEALGREVAIADASVGLTGFRLVGLDVRGEDAEPPLVSAARVELGWKLLPLLSQRVEITEAELIGPSFSIVRLEDGSLDISDLLATGENNNNETDAPATDAAPATEAPPSSDWAVTVHRFAVENGRLRFEDRMETPPRVYEVDGITAEVTGLGRDTLLSFGVSAKLPNLGDANFLLAGNAELVAQTFVGELKLTEISLAALNPWMGDGMQFAAGKGHVALPVNVKGINEIEVLPSLTIEGLRFKGPGGEGDTADLRIVADLLFKPEAEKIQVNTADLSAAGQEIHVEGVLACIVGVPCATLGLTADTLDVDALLALLPPAGKTGKNAPSGDNAPSAAKPDATEPIGELPVDLDAKVRIQRILFSGMELSDATAHLESQKGVVRMDPLTAKLYGGSFYGRARVDLTKAGPPFAAKEELDGVDVGALLAAAMPELEGTLTGEMDLSAVTDGVGDDLTSLQSKLTVTIGKGQLIGHPMAAEAARFFNAPELETINFYAINAEARSARGVATLDKFRLDGKDVRVNAKGTLGLLNRELDTRVKAGVAQPIAAKLLHDKNIIEALTGEDSFTTVPLRVTGTVTQPSYGLDEELLTDLATELAKKEAKKAIQKEVMEQVPDEVKDLVPGVMDKLFGK